MRQLILFTVVILLWSLLAIFPMSVYASPMVEIIPSRFELLVEPRERSIQSIVISNHGKEELTLIASSRDWDMGQTDSLILFDAATTPRSASNWLRFNPRRFTIPSGKTQIIRFAVTAPPQLEAGEYRTAIVLETKEEYEIKDNYYYQPIFAVLVYVNVPEVKRVGELDEIVVTLDDQGNYILNGKLYSTGNAHLRTEGEFLLRDSKGLIVKRERLGKQVVLPGKNIKFKINLGKKLDSGEYQGEILWRYIPAFYLEDQSSEYNKVETELIKKVKITIK